MSFQLPSRSLVKNSDQSMTERPDIQRSRFHGSWTRNTTFDAGFLVPFLVDEILPGDMMRYDVTAYLRMATPLFPMFDNQQVHTFFFFVPNRLVWENWQRFMGEQKSPGDSIAYTVPKINSDAPPSGFAGGWPIQSLGDHFGLPGFGQLAANASIACNALPWRAYALIFNEWFRDENVQNPLPIALGDTPGSDTVTNRSLVRRNKMHDYFTSVLPWPQKFTAPSIPLSGQAPVTGLGYTGDTFQTGPTGTIYESTGATTSYLYFSTEAFKPLYVKGSGGSAAYPQIFAQLGEAAGIQINSLRQSIMVQTLLERDARGGTRYTELIRAHFGVVSPDARLQRPEYLGGGVSPIQLTPIAQSAPTAGVPLGALGAAATSVGQHRASYAATEHGFIIGLINIQSELSYQQGINRMFLRDTRYDYYWPSLAHLGEQVVTRAEIYAKGDPALDILPLGYQERWHEYRTRYSEVTGQFRSNITGTLDAWHLSQNFTAAPTLGNTFLQDIPPMGRVLAAGDLSVGQQYLANILIKREATRPLPVFGTPASLGRF